MLAISLSALLGTTAPAAQAAPSALGLGTANRPTNNIATNTFSLLTSGLDLRYICHRQTVGHVVQVTSPNQGLAFREFPAHCDGGLHTIDNIYAKVPLGTNIRARIHSNRNGRFTGFIQAFGIGRG